MVKFPEAENRRFHSMFVCKKCKTRMKAPNLKIIEGKISCRKCKANKFRPVKKK